MQRDSHRKDESYGSQNHSGERKRKYALPQPRPSDARKMSDERRETALAAAKLILPEDSSNRDDLKTMKSLNERNIAIYPGSASDIPANPNTIRRSVSAFGETTVMPVGPDEDYDDDEIVVDEEL